MQSVELLPFFAGFKAKLRRLTNAARTAQFRRNGPFGAAFAEGGGAAAGAAGGAGAGNAFASFDAPGCIMNSTRRGAVGSAPPLPAATGTE
jgi:hypothetical protein